MNTPPRRPRSELLARWRELGPTRRLATIFAVLLLATLWMTSGGDARAAAPTWPRQDILDAIRWVESGDRVDVRDGDDGLAIGPYQIHRVYWLDAMAFEPELGEGDGYQRCRERDYAERVIDAYMRRYVPDAWRVGDAEVIARVHNGGPKGDSKRATDRYWLRVLERLTTTD